MIDLKEIIWEITAQCKNGCAYCGSADITDVSNLPNEDLITIAKNIAAYPPKEINISGGDPTLVDVTVHKEIVKIFREAGIIPKILINPISLSKYGVDVVSNIVELYDAIGVSINTEEEYSIFYDNFTSLRFINSVTIISNFNKSNLWLFDKLLDLAKTYNRPWQIMVTMYPLNNDNAIYESELATTEFFNKIGKINYTPSKYNKVILADNINAGKCTAGIHSLGILDNGDVVPCLSMRAWDDIYQQVQGNILCSNFENPLKHIWENEFRAQRFSKFKCCQDHCNNIGRQYVSKKDPLDFPLNPMSPTIPTYPNIPSPKWPKPNDYPPSDIVMVYGVGMDRHTMWELPTPEIDTSNIPSWEEIVKKQQDKKD